MTAFGFPLWICLVWLFILGTVVGSFLNVCVYRIPQHERLSDALHAVIFPKSRCPRCRNAIPPWANVPVLGWLLLRGRCFHCKGRISPRYPLVEFGNGLLWVLIYWLEIPADWHATIADSAAQGPFGPEPLPGSAWMSATALLHWRYFYHLLLIEALVVASLIDIDLRIIPDASTLPALLAGVVGATLLGRVWLTPVWHQNVRIARDLQYLLPDAFDGLFLSGTVPEWIAHWPHLHGLAVSLAGIVVGGGLVWLIRIVGHWAIGREAMGFGDVILMALIGSFLGWQAAILTFFLAPLFALLVVAATFLFRRQRELPFGPYLSLAALFVILRWKELWASAEPAFGSGPLLLVVALIMLLGFAVVMRLIRRLLERLGFAAPPGEGFAEWTSADHLFHFSGETVDPHFGRWPGHDWPGTQSGRGWTQYAAWRHGPSGAGSQKPPALR